MATKKVIERYENVEVDLTDMTLTEYHDSITVTYDLLDFLRKLQSAKSITIEFEFECDTVVKELGVNL